MRVLCRLIPFVLLASIGAASAAVEIPVEGRILAPGGNPLSEVEVLLTAAPDPVTAARHALDGTRPEVVSRARTDAEGWFRLAAPHAGHWKVRVDHPGFVPMEKKLVGLLGSRDLDDVKLAPDAGLKIRVAAPDGGPVPGALVRLSGGGPDFRMGQSPTDWRPAVSTAVTGDDGAARLPRQDGKHSELTVWAPGRAYVEREIVHGTATTVELDAAPERTVEVRSEEGSPEPGVLVVVGERRFPIGFTDEAGRIAVPTLAGEDVSVALTASDTRTASARVSRVTGEQPPLTVVLPGIILASGRVIDASSRRAIPGALVWSFGEEWKGVVTDGSGNFTIGGAPNERTYFRASAAGYLTTTLREFAFEDPPRRGPAIALEPAAVIEGTVVDENGDSVPGAETTVDVKQAPGLMRISIGARERLPEARTTSRGQFRLSPLDPDHNYELKVRAEGYGPAQQEVLDLKPYEVRRGQRIVLKQGLTATGLVLDEEDQPVSDAKILLSKSIVGDGSHGRMIRLEGGGAPVEFEGDTGPDGTFEISGLAHGKYDIDIKRSGFASKTAQGLDVPEGADPADLGTFNLEPGERIQGQVLDPDGQPIDGAKIFVQQGGMTFMMAGGRPQTEEPSATTTPDGWFAVDDLKRGTTVDLSVRREGYVAGSGNAVKVPSPEPVKITMHPASRVSGTVVDSEGNGIAGAAVTLERTSRAEMGGRVMMMMSQQSDQADAEGRFEFTDLEPGEITLKAVASGWQETKLDRVEVPEGEDLDDVRLELQPGSILEGRVRATDGRPAIQATVRAVDETSQPFRFGGAYTDGDGFYRLEGLTPGEVSIEATHDEYPRVVKDVELDPGINTLDLQFEGGQEVSGIVVDEGGSPIGGAMVELNAVGRVWGGPETISSGDGTFSIAGVSDGEYRAVAYAEGYAATDEDIAVTVAGEPVAGVEIRMARGGSIVGNVIGLEADHFPEVEIEAVRADRGGFESAGLDHMGRYRVPDLSPGTWNVTATLGDSGRQATGQALLEPGVPEVHLDLEFGRGIVLSGRVLEGSAPVIGGTVFAGGQNVDRSGWARTDSDGGFSIEGLEPGTYRVDVRHWEKGLSHDETYELTGDREVTIRVPTQRILGQVLDASDKKPVAGATITLEPPDSSTPMRVFPSHGATSDQEGKFTLSRVAEGNWRLTANKKGYAAATEQVYVQRGQDVDNMRIALDPTEGLALEVRLPSNQFPTQVRVAVLDGTGTVMVHGDYATGENGRVRLSSVPAGSWELIVGAAGAASTTLQANAPGGVTLVRLPAPCAMSVIVPELAGTGSIATVTMTGADGRPYRTVGWFGTIQSEWSMRDGQRDLDSMPPGTFNVTVKASDGRAWQGTVTTSAVAPATLLLE